MRTSQTVDRVTEAMRQASRSVAWTAAKVGMPPATLARRLHEGPDFTIAELSKLARALGVAPSSLLPAA